MSDTDNARITELQNRNAVGARAKWGLTINCPAKFLSPDVRFGSKADMTGCICDVRFTSQSGHWQGAKSGHLGASWNIIDRVPGKVLKLAGN